MKYTGVIKSSLIAALIVGMALPSMAVLSLPIADDAHTSQGLMRLGAGATLESDMNIYGGRFTYGVAEGIAAFVGGGIVDPDRASNEPFLQLGGQYTLPVKDLPFDLAARASFGIVSFDEKGHGWKTEVDLWVLNFGVLGSKELDMFTVYGYLGISYQDWEASYSSDWNMGSSVSFSDTETELAIGAGVLYPMDERISFYGELMHIDDLFFSVGGRYQF